MPSLFVLLVLTLASSATGLRIGLTRIHSNPDATTSEFMREAVRRDMSRHARFGRELASSDVTIVAPTKGASDGSEYFMTLAIGTPPMELQAIIDTGSNVITTQCATCNSKCFKQPDPMYDQSSSSTFATLPCNSSLRLEACDAVDDGENPPAGCPCERNITYSIGWTFVTMGVETFTFGSDQVELPNTAFGCITDSGDDGGDWEGSAGMVGLGRGNLSLVSQLGAGKLFSYCFTPFQDANSTSTLLIGRSAVLNDSGVSSTPFVVSPSEALSYYYLNLTGISIGTTKLDIPADAFSLKTDGSGGFMIDSGWTTTELVDAAYQKVWETVKSIVKLPETAGLRFDCFKLPSQASKPPDMPTMTFHFDGADMLLPADNYMFLNSDVWCLRMHNAGVSATSVLGNYQQQNMHLLYDLEKEMLSFAPADCSMI